MKFLSVVGARPQFIKATLLSKTLRQRGHKEILAHTGQHYDFLMSEIFFKELEIPVPDINLEVGSGSAGWQIGEMLIGLDKVITAEKPDWVLVFGDTNSTLAGALAAAKAGIPLAHIEAGLRSYNKSMPEEQNRIITDHCSKLLFCPTQTAVENLKREAIIDGVQFVGDTMYDAVLKFAPLARKRSILDDLGLQPKSYLLATVHRASNSDIPENLHAILSALEEIEETVIFPLHPRTRDRLKQMSHTDSKRLGRVRLTDPVSYLDMLALEQNARLILTDSGGVQKEAYFFQIPCITLRKETEWVETVQTGWNALTGVDPAQIKNAVRKKEWPNRVDASSFFGRGDAVSRIVSILESCE